MGELTEQDINIYLNISSDTLVMMMDWISELYEDEKQDLNEKFATQTDKNSLYLLYQQIGMCWISYSWEQVSKSDRSVTDRHDFIKSIIRSYPDLKSVLKTIVGQQYVTQYPFYLL